MGEVLGSIGEDGQFKLWEEDIAENPLSGRRFKLIYSHTAPGQMPIMSVDFKNINTETYLALITRNGYLMVCEPVDHDDLSNWRNIFADQIQPPPPLHDEASFRVAFHREKIPCYTAILAGLDRKALSLAVASMETVKVYRTDKDRELYVAAELHGANGIIRDVAWANGAVRGFDIIATACKDGVVRVYELTTPLPLTKAVAAAMDESKGAEKGTANGIDKDFRRQAPSSGNNVRSVTSGISTELASVSKTDDYKAGDAADRQSRPDRVKHQVKLAAELRHHYGAVWRVSFSPIGMSSYQCRWLCSHISCIRQQRSRACNFNVREC